MKVRFVHTNSGLTLCSISAYISLIIIISLRFRMSLLWWGISNFFIFFNKIPNSKLLAWDFTHYCYNLYTLSKCAVSLLCSHTWNSFITLLLYNYQNCLIWFYISFKSFYFHGILKLIFICWTGIGLWNNSIYTTNRHSICLSYLTF